MPRSSRELSESKIYHVMSRALNRQDLFEEEEDFLFYLQKLRKACENYEVEIFAYCLMTNHVHLLILDKGDQIHGFMKSLNTSYARYFNRKNFRIGYVFNDRFRSEPINDEKYLLTVARYIHQNPVKALICNQIYDYKFSSIHAYRRAAGNYLDLVNTSLLLGKCGKDQFLSFNEMQNQDNCMDVMCNRLDDAEVAKLLFKAVGVRDKIEFLKLADEEKLLAAKKLVDISIPMMQIARVSGIYYSKIQKLKSGASGKTVSLTYSPRK